MSKEKFEVVYENEETKSIWTYDRSVTTFGPVSVEIVYKNEPEVTKSKRKSKNKQKL